MKSKPMHFEGCRICADLVNLLANSIAATEKAFFLRASLMNGKQEANRGECDALDEELRQNIAAKRYVEDAMRHHGVRAHFAPSVAA